MRLSQLIMLFNGEIRRAGLVFNLTKLYIKSSHRYSCSYFIFVPNLVDYGFFPISFYIHVFSNTHNGFTLHFTNQPRWLSGLTRSSVHSQWLLVDQCVLSNWDRILVRAVKGLISRAGMVSICPLLWQRDVKLQQTLHFIVSYLYNFYYK